MIRPLLAAAAVLAVAAPSAAAHGGGATDAEIFATDNTAVITDQNDPRLDDRLYRFADRVEDIIRDGGGKPRGSELLDGVFFDGGLTFERSRRFDVDRVSGNELHDIAETVRRRFLQGSVLTFDHLDRKDPGVDAIELDVPHVSAKALRDGLVKDQDAAARLFGGSVTQDRHLLLVAALEDADLARTFAKKIGGDVKHATTSYGQREFVSADSDGRARIEKRTLVITGTPGDDTILLREGRRLSIDFKADGVVDFEPSERRFDRIRVEGGAGDNDTVAFAGTDRADEFDLTKDRLQLDAVEIVDVSGGDGEDRVTVDDHTVEDQMTVTVNVDLGADGVVDRVVANGSSQRDFVSVMGFNNTVYVIGPTFVQIDGADRFDRLRVNGRGNDDQIDASTDLMKLTLDGGDGGGTLFGGPGDDVLIGGDGFDEVSGGKGSDRVDMRGYFDRFTWRAGDGLNDTVDGGPSTDSILIQGANRTEVFDFFRFGHRVRLSYQGADVEAVDFEDMEEVDVMAFGGEDLLGVRDLAGTGVKLIDVGLDQFLGGVNGDKAADQIHVEGSDGDDDLTVTGKKIINGPTGTVTVDGMAAKLILRATEGALDSLAIDTLGGDDHVDSSGLEPNLIQLQAD